MSTARWKVFGASVRGATHIRRQLPNQDAWNNDVRSDGAPPVIVAVSDGHGSEHCFRSDVGSQLAVEAAVTECKLCLEGLSNASPSEIKDTIERRFLGHLVRAWKERVKRHAAEHPMTDDELARLRATRKTGVENETILDAELWRAYGATLLVLVLTETYALYLQLGDGEMLVVSDSAVPTDTEPSAIIVSRPLPKDDSLIANETTSLCRDDAERQFRIRLQLFEGRPPALFLLSTDGYSNAFESSAGFEQVGGDLLRALREQGLEAVSRDFTDELNHVSEQGSGDDVTVAIVFRDDSVPQTASPPSSDRPRNWLRRLFRN